MPQRLDPNAPLPAGSAALGEVSITELPAAAVFPAANSQAISGLSVTDIRAFLAVLDANGDINSSLLGARQANSDAFTGAGVGRWLQTIAFGHKLDGTRVVRERMGAEWTQVGSSAANTAQTLTQAAGAAGVRNFCYGFAVQVIAAAAVNDTLIELKDGSTVKWRAYIGAAAAVGTIVQREFSVPIQGTAATAMTLEVAAGGAAVVTVANMCGVAI